MRPQNHHSVIYILVSPVTMFAGGIFILAVVLINCLVVYRDKGMKHLIHLILLIEVDVEISNSSTE